MDLNQTQSGESKEASPPTQQMPKVQLPKMYLPKFKLPNLKEKLHEYGRVLKITQKPDAAEFKAIVKASGLGMAVIGAIGFIIAIIVQLTGFGL